MCRATIVPSAGQQLQLGDEEQIDERLARRAHELEGRQELSCALFMQVYNVVNASCKYLVAQIVVSIVE